MVNPAKLAWGLAAAAERRGGTILEALAGDGGSGDGPAG